MTTEQASSTLKHLCETVLGTNIGPDVLEAFSFVQLGGDSLKAIKLVALAHQSGIQLRVGGLLQDIPLGQSLTTFEVQTLSVPPGPLEAERLTPAQRGMIAHELIVYDTPYNLVFVVKIEGSDQVDLLCTAIKHTVSRHDGLRTYFNVDIGNVQRLVKPCSWSPPISVLHGENLSNVSRLTNTVVAENGKNAFDLFHEPPLTFTIIESGLHLELVLCVHHALVDGWSIGVLFTEVLTTFDALINRLPLVSKEPPIQPNALDAHLNSLNAVGEVQRQTDYWFSVLSDIPSMVEIPSDAGRPHSIDVASDRKGFRLSDKQHSAVVARALHFGVTPFCIFLASFGLLLHRYSGLSSFVVGVPAPRRPYPNWDNLIASCANLVPVVMHIDPRETISQYVKGVQRAMAQSLEHSDVPFDELVRKLHIKHDFQRNPLIQFVVEMHSELIQRRFELTSFVAEISEGRGGGTPFDMALFIEYREPTFGGEIEFSSALFSGVEIDAFIDNYFSVLDELCATSDRSIGDIRGISSAQFKRMSIINSTGARIPPVTVDNLVLDRAMATPEAVAIESPASQLAITYRQLDHLSGVQTTLLHQHGVEAGDVVLVSMGDPVAEAIALLGVTRLGATYMAVDNKWPIPRIETLVKRTRPSAAIAPPAEWSRLMSSCHVKIVPHYENNWDYQSSKFPRSAPDPERLAYITFTSGSTGEPKGVCIPHRGIIRLVDGSNFTNFGIGERWLRLSPLAFDASTLEVWGPLVNGGTMVCYSPNNLSVHELGDFIVSEKITRLWLTVGLFRLLVDFEPTALRGVRQVITGGDVVPLKQVKTALDQNPGLTVTNGYGPTENTTFTTTYSYSKNMLSDYFPIGKPIQGTVAYIVDSEYRIVPPGAIGKLLVSGTGLFMGYLNDPKATEQVLGRLTPDVEDVVYDTGDLVRMDAQNNLRFVGREDSQVKIRGFRVEPEEVQSVICDLPNVRDSVVFAVNFDHSKHLVAAIVPRGSEIDFIQLRLMLRENVPDFMVPSHFFAIRDVPLTPNGKIDYKLLETLYTSEFNESENVHDACDLVDPVVVEAFESILRCGGSGLKGDDDFFDLGGDSLAFMRLIALLEQTSRTTLSLRIAMENPTVSGLSTLISRAREAMKK